MSNYLRISIGLRFTPEYKDSLNSIIKGKFTYQMLGENHGPT